MRSEKMIFLDVYEGFQSRIGPIQEPIRQLFMSEYPSGRCPFIPVSGRMQLLYNCLVISSLMPVAKQGLRLSIFL